MVFIKFFLSIVILQCCQLVDAKDWQLQGLQINNSHNHLKLHIKSLETPFIENDISNIHYDCRSDQQIYPFHKCKKGYLSFVYDGASYHFLFDGWLNFSKNSWDINIANTNQNVMIHSSSIFKNRVEININKMKLTELSSLLERFMDINTESASAIITAKVTIDLTESLEVKASYNITDISWESDDGEYILADSQLQGEVVLKEVLSGLDFSMLTNIAGGEGLFKDIYLSFVEYPLKVKSHIILDENWQPTKTNLKVSATEDVKFEIDILNWLENKINVKYDIKNLAVFYSGFISSYLEIIGINNVDVTGQSQGHVYMDNGEIIDFAVESKNLNLDIASMKTNIKDLNANIYWQASGKWKASEVNWQKLLLAGMPINQSKLYFYTVSEQLKLQENTVIPIFDGSVVIHKLELSDLFASQIAINFDGDVTPISLALVTKKMGWPLMNGNISGNIPGMKKQGHSITFDGSLDLTVFDGQMKIDNLSMERLFGVAPVIAADINFNQLNLQHITSTFDFGEITGLIDGYVNGLRITNWKADRLDAYIQSTKKSKIKQTISQRAIDNISSIGGVQGALSRSFLRFFEYFKYKRIGIGCKLRSSICEMRGIETQSDAYHIIEGKGIPSINIIGIRKFIDWEVFLDRLLNAGY